MIEENGTIERCKYIVNVYYFILYLYLLDKSNKK